MPIRILHVIDSLGNGGLENGVVNLIRHMDATRFEHCVCTVRAMGPNAQRLPLERVKLIHIGENRNSRTQFGALGRVIRELRPDVVHSRNWGGIEAVIASRLRGCGVVHSEHGFEAQAGAGETWRRRCFRRLAFELAHRVLCVSERLRETCARSTGFDASRITVIHNGVDAGRFSPSADERLRVRRELAIAEGEFCVGCVGNLAPVKGYGTLLEALRRLGAAAKGWRLVIAGEGPERSKLEAAAREAERFGARVSFLGRSARVPELLNAFDVYALPSLNEGISNSLLEAMATGLPVLASDAGGTPEVVEDGRSGVLFHAGDANALSASLLRLYEQRDWRDELGRNARCRTRGEFSIASMVRGYAGIYESLARGAVSALAAVEG